MSIRHGRPPHLGVVDGDEVSGSVRDVDDGFWVLASGGERLLEAVPHAASQEYVSDNVGCGCGIQAAEQQTSKQ